VIVHEGVNGHRQPLRRHHQQVGDGQVHDEDVGLKFKYSTGKLHR
jgi:hypothetical protein